jgi:hypothetical protein
MSHTQIDEPINVYALYEMIDVSVFSGPGRSKVHPHKKLKPLSFTWRQREYEIKELTYVWHNKNGETDYYYFAVSDGANIYELVYNAKTFDWMLHRIYCEG